MTYAWEQQLNKKPTKRISSFESQFGPKVIKRDAKGKPLEIRFDLYFPTSSPLNASSSTRGSCLPAGTVTPLPNKESSDVHIVGKFSNWKINEQYRLQRKDDNFLTITLTRKEIKHCEPYLFKIGNKLLRDPFSIAFDDDGNSVFWDHGEINLKIQKIKRNILEEPLKILQTDLPGLITHWRDGKGRLGHEVGEKNYFKFIQESGVIPKIAELGFNAIQFLPISQSIDGGKWSYRYLAPFLNALNKNCGTPSEFRQLVDEFHKHGIAVILDFVISHVPHKDYKLFAKPANEVGIHLWDEFFDPAVQLIGEETSWGTKRYNYNNPIAQQFVTESALFYLKNYGVDGFRIDNIDGIIREGDSGEGDERPYGREVIRNFTSTIYEYKPDAVINFESHYFYEDNAKLLVQPVDKDTRALGATAYTSSRLTYFFHTDYMPKAADEISPWTMQHIIDEKEWGKSNSTIADFHNHDAAAGLMAMRATGSYAYDALINEKQELHYHAVGKIKVMETIISLLGEGRTLDLLQTHLLQEGTFEHDSTIHWFLEMKDANRGVLNFKAAINKLMDEKAFWPSNVKFRKIINIDEKTKTFVFVRESKSEENFVIVINMGAFLIHNYEIPVPKNTPYELVLNSDEFRFAGSGRAMYAPILKPIKTTNFEFFTHAIEFPIIAPYGVVVIC